jgi:hypothetical protein
MRRKTGILDANLEGFDRRRHTAMHHSSRCHGGGGHYNGHRGALAPQTPRVPVLSVQLPGSENELTLGLGAEAKYDLCYMPHIADLSSTDTNYTLLQPHNEISRPLLKLGPRTHQLNGATPE